MSIEKLAPGEPVSATIIDVTPDELIMIARKMETFATAAVNPGEEVLLYVTSRVVFKFNPKVSTMKAANKKIAPNDFDSQNKPAMPQTLQPAARPTTVM